MATTLIGLHGFTMNGAGLRHLLADLAPRLPGVALVCPDAPHAASEDSVAGLAAQTGGFRAKPPNLQWWSASESRDEYRGWAASRELLRALVGEEAAQQRDFGLLGFSQGAAVAASLAAAASRGEFPAPRFVVLVAGFLPRDREIAASFAEPVRVPSLHVLGDADPFAKHGPALYDRFDPATRELLRWPGRHAVPTSGEAGDALLQFISKHAAAAREEDAPGTAGP